MTRGWSDAWPAPAKLNLFLHVVGRRPDGYHLLQSVFVPIDWADELHFEVRGDGRLQRHDLGPELPADDLCLRAARLLQSASGCTQGADIHIDKKLPWGAGLGGGSSDAATTLIALNRLWGLHWPRTRLAELGLRLGADVPFFIGGRPAWVEGIGERLQPISITPRWWAVLKPPASIPTVSIFSSPLLVRDTAAAILTDFLAHYEAGQLPGHNDLQPPAEAACGEVTQALRCLDQVWGHSRMTGSGSAVFACAGTGESPVPSAPANTWVPNGWTFRLCRSLAVHPLCDWVDDDPGAGGSPRLQAT